MVLYMFLYMSIESSRIIIIPIRGGAAARAPYTAGMVPGLKRERKVL